MVLTEQEIEFLENFRKLTTEEQKEIIEEIKRRKEQA